MPLSDFHPAVAAWFAAACGEPSPAQRLGWPAIRAGGHVLISAPTGTGKTLAAFLVAIDRLIRQGPWLAERCQVLYVSPLRALSNDMQKNLLRPLEAIAGSDALLPRLRVAVRTGDTDAADRAKMRTHPPHLLVTTPESLYVLLTSSGGRELLSSVSTVIVDEIHALAGNKRGAHLALSLERLDALIGAPIQRIGLSATASPLSGIARFLAGAEHGADRAIQVIDAGGRRVSDLGVEIPQSPLAAVCSHEHWAEIYQRIAELVLANRTTLVFVNTRKMAERLALRLGERLEESLGKDAVSCHHGSLAKDRRLAAEQRLKSGELRCLVATGTLELGIDIGEVDLVVQVGSPHAIHTFLQRLGRAGHGPARTPKARLFALTSDELIEAAALMDAIRRGDLDAIPIPLAPLDVLAQQIVAACVGQTWHVDDLRRVLTGAEPYRAVDAATFSRVVEMHADGRRALLHNDPVAGTVRGTRRARLTALMNGGAIPDTALFQVREDASDLLVGTLDEDFSLESSPGDVFQLGTTAWRITRVEGRTGIVRVVDARGAPPTIPFWFGEAPGRTRELSAAVGRLRRECDGPAWLENHCGLSPGTAAAAWNYLDEARRSLGALPTDRQVVAERFFDEAGGQHLVIHAPFGTRILRAWGLALRKRFCAGFGNELEAAANDEALLLSLAPTTSFPLEEVFAFLSPETLRKTLLVACLTGGQFETGWRQAAQLALIVERSGTAGKVPAFLQRVRAADALLSAFPQATACPDNLPPDRIVIPVEHPVVAQVVTDLLTTFDAAGLAEVLAGIRSGAIAVHAVETAEASPLARGILAAKPYAFLDDVPFEERRSRTVAPAGTSRRLPPVPGDLELAAVAAIRAEIWPAPRDREELHEILQWIGWLSEAEIELEPDWRMWLDQLVAAGRAEWYGGGEPCYSGDAMRGAGDATLGTENATGPSWHSALPEGAGLDAFADPQESSDPSGYRSDGPQRPPGWVAAGGTLDDTERWNGRLESLGPVPFTELSVNHAAALALEGRGVLMRCTVAGEPHWCLKHLVQRIHRRMLDTRRGNWQAPASAEACWRFLAQWQGVGAHRHTGRDGLAESLRQLTALELPADAWCRLVLPARVSDVRPEWLDELTLAGEFVWGRLWRGSDGSESGDPDAPPPRSPPLIRTTPITLIPRSDLPAWQRLAGPADAAGLSGYGQAVVAAIDRGGALFTADLAERTRLLPDHLERGLGEAIAAGLITADSFAALRWLLLPSERRAKARAPAGRWCRFRVAVSAEFHADPTNDAPANDADAALVARTLLGRTGVVMRRLYDRERIRLSWREVHRALRVMELRGECLGGRFVAGLGGEQFALPAAAAALRQVASAPPSEPIPLSAADPLNYTGILVPGDRVRAAAGETIIVG